VDGKKIYGLNKVPITSDENVNDIDLKKRTGGRTSTDVRGGQKETRRAGGEADQRENDVKALNDKLAARALPSRRQLRSSRANHDRATQIDPNRDLIWFTMGEALRGQAKGKEKTDRAGSKEAYGKAAEALPESHRDQAARRLLQ